MTRPAPLCEVCGLPNRSRPLRAHAGSWRCRDAVSAAVLLRDGFVSVGHLNAYTRANVLRYLGARAEGWTREGPRFAPEQARFCGRSVGHPGKERALWVKHWLAVMLVCHEWNLKVPHADVLSALFQDTRLASDLVNVYTLGHREAALAFLEAEVVPRVRLGRRGNHRLGVQDS